MKAFGMLLVSSIISACSAKEVKDIIAINMPYALPVEQESAFDGYFKMFDAYYGTNSSKLASSFTKIKENHTIGLCYIYSNGYRKIEIDSDFWSKSTENQKESLIFHELAHCLLNKNHNDNYITIYVGPDLLEYQIPESIMNSGNFGNMWYYETYKEYYLDQLKSN